MPVKVVKELPNAPLFEEKQYIGYNKYSMLRRMVLAIFCFLAFYWTERGDSHGHLFFVVGIAILVISGLLLFALHLHTRIYKGYIVLDGLWTARKVKIDLGSIISAEKTSYDPMYVHNPVYNLHRKGTIRFYTSGNEAVKLTDKEGLVYLIGSQRPMELWRVINEQLKTQVVFQDRLTS